MEYDVELEKRIRYVEEMISLENDRINDLKEAHEKRSVRINTILTTMIVILSIITSVVAMKEIL
jgi:hypothetical protein